MVPSGSRVPLSFAKPPSDTHQSSISQSLPPADPEQVDIPQLGNIGLKWSSSIAYNHSPASNSFLPHEAGRSDDSDDEMDWEEVAVAAASNQQPDIDQEPENRGIEIILESNKQPQGQSKKTRLKGISALDRLIRLESHKLHAICLLTNASIRNTWINDPLLHARLMSLTPLELQNPFQVNTKKNQPDAVKRARLFMDAIQQLTTWWHDDFFQIEDGLGIKSRTFAEVEAQRLARERKRKGKGKAAERSGDESDEDEEDDEFIKSPKSLMKHVLLRRGSRDISAQLFTALCRALNVPARLVVSLQAVPWSAKGAALQGRTANLGAGLSDTEDVRRKSSERPNIVSDAPGSAPTGSKAPPVIKLRKSKSKRRPPVEQAHSSAPEPPPDGWPPVFWTEVFSRPEGRWISVDPSRRIVNKKKKFEPPANDRNNRMTYVLAFEEDGYARDVTARYALHFTEKTTKVRVAGKSAGKKHWWEKVLSFLARPYRLNRDDIEDNELHISQMTEPMPTAMGGFKDHPIYALERHLKKDEVIYPKKEIGKFRGEPVYARSSVQSLKTSENWMRQGRTIKQGQQALKTVKQRATTLHRKRALEMASADGEQPVQGMYAEWQTELYIPDPIVDGKIPKNDFGNIDLYVQSMLPSGGVHVPFKGVAKIARELGIDYAEAVTGFEFKKGRAFPIITGVVIATDNEEILLCAYWESAQAAEEKERTKRQDRVIKRWVKLVQGLRIHQRMNEQYVKGDRSLGNNESESTMEAVEQAGGFITEYDNILHPFHLPRSQHVLAVDPAETEESHSNAEDTGEPPPDASSDNEMKPDDSGNRERVDATQSLQASIQITAPRTMRELAEDALDHDTEAVVMPITRTPRSSTKHRSRQVSGTNPTATTPPSSDANRKRKRQSPSHGAQRAEKNSLRRMSAQRTDPRPTRTLRPRAGKTAEKLREEQEIEAAFKRAIGEDSE